MPFFQTVLAARIIFILGIINIVFGVLAYFTCRCVPGSKIASKLMDFGWYQRVYSWHCYIWLIFWVSAIVHAVFALLFYGWPG